MNKIGEMWLALGVLKGWNSSTPKSEVTEFQIGCWEFWTATTLLGLMLKFRKV